MEDLCGTRILDEHLLEVEPEASVLDNMRTWNDAFALVRPDDPIVDQIIGVFSGVTSVHERDADLARLWFRELPYASPSTQDAANDVVAWAQHRLETLLDSARTRGELDGGVDIVVLARMCLDLWIALMIRRHSGGITATAAIERLAAARTDDVSLHGSS